MQLSHYKLLKKVANWLKQFVFAVSGRSAANYLKHNLQNTICKIYLSCAAHF